MKNIGIFVNRDRDKELLATKKAASVLIQHGKNVLIDALYSAEIDLDVEFVSQEEMFKRADMIITLGGDGTILKIIGEAANNDVPIMGINLGHLGFLTQAEKDDDSALCKLLNGEYTIHNPMMLEVKVFRGGEQISSYHALNDIILRGSDAKMISLQVEVDGTVTNQYLGDGIIVSTSTGSTAYSLSCGGPIVHQKLNCIILTPICAHTLKSRCIVVPPDSSVILRFDPSYCAETELKADGFPIEHLKENDYIKVVASPKKPSLINLNNRDYFDVIRKKLSD